MYRTCRHASTLTCHIASRCTTTFIRPSATTVAPCYMACSVRVWSVKVRHQVEGMIWIRTTGLFRRFPCCRERWRCGSYSATVVSSCSSQRNCLCHALDCCSSGLELSHGISAVFQPLKLFCTFLVAVVFLLRHSMRNQLPQTLQAPCSQPMWYQRESDVRGSCQRLQGQGTRGFGHG